MFKAELTWMASYIVGEFNLQQHIIISTMMVALLSCENQSPTMHFPADPATF